MWDLNWKKNKDLPFNQRVMKTLSDTPVLSDVVMRMRLNLEPMKDKELANRIIEEYATKGGLSKRTQKDLLNYKDSYISDKNREWFNHLENEIAIRKQVNVNRRKLKDNLKDPLRIKNTHLSWTEDSRATGYYIYIDGQLVDSISGSQIIGRMSKQYYIDSGNSHNEDIQGNINGYVHYYSILPFNAYGFGLKTDDYYIMPFNAYDN